MKSILSSTIYFATGMVAVGLISRFLFGGVISWAVVLSSFVAGILIGFIFVVATRWTVKRELSRIVIQFNEGEKILKESFVSRFEGTRAVWGKLMLTDRRLIFKSTILNIHIQPVQDVFELEQFEKVSKTKINLFRNGLTIGLKDSRTEKFVVEGAGEWVEVLDHQISRVSN